MLRGSSVVEQSAVNRYVAGSSPARAASRGSSMVEQGLCKAKVVGSSPTPGTI
jgi:hypothetical protein